MSSAKGKSKLRFLSPEAAPPYAANTSNLSFLTAATDDGDGESTDRAKRSRVSKR